MSDVDELAFDIAFALRQRPIGADASRRISSLHDEAVDQLLRVVAEHLRVWQREPASAPAYDG